MGLEKTKEVGLIDLWIFSVGAAHGREKLRAMGRPKIAGMARSYISIN